MSKPLRVAFFGSPAWAVPVLEALADRHDVILAVTQPDKPAGRGLKLTESPVASRARELGIPVEKPKRLKKNADFLQRFRALAPDAAVVAAYGKIIPGEVLEVPRYGFLNIHPSLLPKYRGAAPVNWALIQGETETGVSIMQLDEGMDTGPLYLQRRVAIAPDETALELSERLRDLGVEMLLLVLEKIDELEPRPQEGEPSYAPLLTKEDGRVRFEDPAQKIYDRHRGVQPWPGSWFWHCGKRIKVHALRPEAGEGAPGAVLEVGPKGVLVAAGERAVRLLEVQPEGKRPMPAEAWARGYGVKAGGRLGDS
jgi:methionyl-tRNA formyltransferase